MRGVRCATLAAVAVFGFASVASAADLPTKAPVYKAPVAAPLYSWTGCYLGAHVGGGWGRTTWANTSGLDEGTSNIDGFLGGGQVGCDYQTGPLVFGAEASFSWANIRGQHRDPVPTFNAQVLHSEVTWLSTVTGRAGYAVDKLLFYVKGGGAWAHDNYWDVDDTRGNIADASETRRGWTVGGGVEYAFAPNWSAKVEYNYLDFGTSRVRLTCPTCMLGFFYKDITQDIHAVKLGLNYRFNLWR